MMLSLRGTSVSGWCCAALLVSDKRENEMGWEVVEGVRCRFLEIGGVGGAGGGREGAGRGGEEAGWEGEAAGWE